MGVRDIRVSYFFLYIYRGKTKIQIHKIWIRQIQIHKIWDCQIQRIRIKVDED